MKYFSLFTGIGGFELGIQQAYDLLSKTETERIRKENPKGLRSEENQGSPQNNQGLGISTTKPQQHPDGFRDRQPYCVGYSEIDKYAIQIYERHFGKRYECKNCGQQKSIGEGNVGQDLQPTRTCPSTNGDGEKPDTQQGHRLCEWIFIDGHKNYGDITKINADELPDFDLLCGGFPCQAFSVAGKRRGFDDTRGTLFFDICRLAKAKRPRLLLLENVKGLLNHDGGQTFRVILSSLDELGYDCQWQVCNSKDFGVPQNRERVIIVGHLRGTPRPQVFPLVPTDGAYSQELSSTTVDANYWKGIDNHGARTAIVQLNNPTHSNDRIYGADGISPTLNTAQGGNRQPKVMRQPLRYLNRNQKNYDGDYAFTVDSSQTAGVRTGMQIRRLTPTECERLQGFPDGWTAGVSDTQRYKTLGNAVTVNVIRAVATKLLYGI